METTPATRLEHDALGGFPVPAEAYYGIATARAAANFTGSGLRLQPAFIRALGVIKRAAARANNDLELLPDNLAEAIVMAAGEVAAGRWDAEFVVDVFQSGSGTSTNMNANEVIANRANEILDGGPKGVYAPVHPNDHVNLGQSSNDVIPTATHLAAIAGVQKRLLPAFYRLESALQAKSGEFDGVVKTGRTHLVDAMPIRLGQEFRGYAGQVERARRRVTAAAEVLREVALGGTAVGTGAGTHEQFAARAIAYINDFERLQLRETTNHFQGQSSIDAIVEASGQLRVVATSFLKIANDLRLMASGPRAGLGEITLPELQPGSSMMPGKVNPVVPEAVIQAAAQVAGNDATIAMAGQWGFFELNTMQTVAAYNLLQSIDLLANAATLLAEKCVAGIAATATGPDLAARSIALVTALASVIGYDRAAAIAHDAAATGRTIREAAEGQTPLTPRELDRLLDPRHLTGQ
ncbi:MAG: class II fumarate hydratase [Chloroflexi bacterium]|nr:class II fumarate hydratase [Chloroflexota bacterium]